MNLKRICALLLGVWLGVMPAQAITPSPPAPQRCLDWQDGAVAVTWCTEISEHITSSVGGADRWWRVVASHTRDGRGVAGDKLVAVAWGSDWFDNPSVCVAYTGADGVGTCTLGLNAELKTVKLAVTIGTFTSFYQPMVYRRYMPLAFK